VVVSQVLGGAAVLVSNGIVSKNVRRASDVREGPRACRQPME
jgi:hypothetical protein